MTERGPQGLQGPQGIKGDSGKAWTQLKITASFWTLVIVSIVLLTYVGYQQKQARDLGNENEARITENEILVRRLVKLQQDTNNRFYLSDAKQAASLRTLLCFGANQVATSKQRTPEEKAEAAQFYKLSLALIDAAPCDKE